MKCHIRTQLPFLACSACWCLIAAGCSDEAAPTAGATANQAADGDAADGQPDRLVARYLAAVKEGDAATVNRLLTRVARQKTTELNIAVAPPGSETARFDVGAVRFVSDEQDAAEVDSQWTELDDEGQPQSVAITWLLRAEDEGWRVAGMQGQFVEGQPVMVFNFENPQQVIQQQDYAREEIMRQQAAQRQALQDAGAAGPADDPPTRR